MATRTHAGGAATAGGMNFQHRATAWVAVHILAEQGISPPWGLPGEVTLEWFRCETEQPVDDLMAGTSHDGLILAQIKHTLQLSPRSGSPLASALDQCVRQFIAQRTGTRGKQPWDRPLNRHQDRLVLITSPGSSAPIRVHLPAALGRLQHLVAGQTIENAAANAAERDALSTVVDHIKRAWQAMLGVPPLDHEVQELLLLLRIHILDVDADGIVEQEAKDRLRTTILRNPEHADTAWALLIALCAQFAAEHAGSDRPGIQQALLNAGIDLQVPRSYREDIGRLRTHAHTTTRLLAQLARIRVSTMEIKIKRPSTDALRHAAEEASLLVVGEPGAGKSGALHDLTDKLIEEERDVVFLAVDHFAASSLGQLRTELGLDRELTEVLTNWPGTAPAFLVIDALDAARTEPVSRAFRNLIQSVAEQQGRWRVVASIRKFDLRYSQDLQHLFHGEPVNSFRDQNFLRVRHLQVPRLSDEEMAQIPSQSPALQALLERASPVLRELLCVPFNLRLMAELLGIGIDPADLTPIRTQLELLDRYWLHRVVRDDGNRDAREGVLLRACEAMVKTRALRVDRLSVAAPGISLVLDDLLSTQILTEWQSSPAEIPEQYVLTFAHHVLFDYAVARLLFRGTPERLLTCLTEDPELVIVVRPSLLLHFQYLWTLIPSHEQFWQLIFQIIQVNQIPEIGKLIGPAIAAELSRALSDLTLLCTAIDSPDQGVRTVADQALRHLTGSLLATTPAEHPLVGSDAGPWCDLLEWLSQHLREPLTYTIRPLLVTVCEHPERFTSAQRIAAGKAARRLLELAWTIPTQDPLLVAYAMQAVCRTFEGDPSASALLLRRCLEPMLLTKYGYEGMRYLVQEVERLIPLDAALVEEIYRTAFTHQESSTEPTPIGSSRILPMTSNRQQDFQMVLYELAEVFPAFLAHASARATSTLMAVMGLYVTRNHHHASSEREEFFVFHDNEACIRTDYSAIWDTGDVYDNDEPLKMLGAFESYVERLAEREENAEELDELIAILIKENRLAVVWRRLLRLGARFPNTLGRMLLPLAWAIPILKGMDTSEAAGAFLTAIFQGLSSETRERVERALLVIPETVPPDHREAGEHIRNRLLGCLPSIDLITHEARRLLVYLQAANAVPPNEPPVRLTSWTGKPFGEEEYLAEEGVPVHAEANQKIRDLEQPVKTFADQRNAIPTLDEVAAVLPALHALKAALARAAIEGVHSKQQDYAWHCLTTACNRIAQIERLSCTEEAGVLARTLLLEASHHADPPHNPKYDANFDEHIGWGSPAVRIEAAEGLILLARHSTCVTTEVVQAIERLSAQDTEPVPAVRFQIASQLNLLYYTAPALMWRMIERLCREEPSRGVLQGLISGPLGRLSGVAQDQVVALTQDICTRVKEGPGADEVRRLCMDVFTGLYIWRSHPLCRDIVLGIAADPLANAADALSILRHFREPLTHGPVHPSNPEQDAIRQRAWGLITQLLCTAYDQLRHVEETCKDVPFNTWRESDQKSTRSLHQIINTIGTEIYFASGVFTIKQQQHTVDRKPLTQEQERFYREAGPLLDILADVGFPSVAHHLLELLEMFIPCDASGIFLRIGRVIRGGQKGGYQYESLGVDLMVGLVERYLAEYRPLLREHDECRQTLLEILDTFVQVGWPQARRLAYRLEEIYQ